MPRRKKQKNAENPCKEYILYKKIFPAGCLSVKLFSALIIFLFISAGYSAAESGVRSNLEFYNNTYRGRNNKWYYRGSGMADIRFDSKGTKNIRSEAALEFYPADLSGGSSVYSAPSVNLKRFWIKANFPSWRLTAGKTKLAWGSGYVFNSGDIIFGSLTPYVDFTRSRIRDDTAWLTAFNIPAGDFSYIELVVLPPAILLNNGKLEIQTIDKTSGGFRFFTKAGRWHLEAGYLYKGDSKVNTDFLGNRPYFSFHGFSGIDFYGSVSLAAGPDNEADINRNNWEKIKKTVNLSLGAFYQIQSGFDSTITMRLETLLMPWQNWSPILYQDIINGNSGYYGITIYPEITWMFKSSLFSRLQAVISPIDASAQITATFGWYVFQGFTLLGMAVINTGNEQSLFAWDRSGSWPLYPPGTPDDGSYFADYEFNGVNITLGARYSF